MKPPFMVSHIDLSGGVRVATTCPGAMHPHGACQVMEFVKLDLKDGAYQGNVKFDLRYCQDQDGINSAILKKDNVVNWEN